MTIAYEGNNSFCFDTDAFRKAASTYATKTVELRAIRSDLVNAIEQLKSTGWKSKAGESFFNNLQSNWATDIDRYIDLLHTLSTIIDEAAREFEDVEEAARNLKVDQGSL